MENYLRCVWMDAGVLSFKLCDRGLACEDCPLDRALRGLELAAGSRLDSADSREEGEFVEVAGAPGLPDFRIQRHFFYAPSHVWAAVENDGRVRLGLDDFAQQLLGPVFRVVLPKPGSDVKRGDPLASFTNQIGAFQVESPLEGTVLWSNHQLLNRPGLVNRAPHSLGSLMVLEPTELSVALRNLKFGEKAQDWLAGESERLSASLLALIEARRPEVGETLQDGGTPSPELLRWMRSDPDFVKVVRRFLKPGGRS